MTSLGRGQGPRLKVECAEILRDFSTRLGMETGERMKKKEMPDVDLAIVIRHCRCAAAKTELCVTVFRFFELRFLSIPESSRHIQLFPTLSQPGKFENKLCSPIS